MWDSRKLAHTILLKFWVIIQLFILRAQAEPDFFISVFSPTITGLSYVPTSSYIMRRIYVSKKTDPNEIFDNFIMPSALNCIFTRVCKLFYSFGQKEAKWFNMTPPRCQISFLKFLDCFRPDNVKIKSVKFSDVENQSNFNLI